MGIKMLHPAYSALFNIGIKSMHVSVLTRQLKPLFGNVSRYKNNSPCLPTYLLT